MKLQTINYRRFRDNAGSEEARGWAERIGSDASKVFTQAIKEGRYYEARHLLAGLMSHEQQLTWLDAIIKDVPADFIASRSLTPAIDAIRTTHTGRDIMDRRARIHCLCHLVLCCAEVHGDGSLFHRAIVGFVATGLDILGVRVKRGTSHA